MIRLLVCGSRTLEPDTEYIEKCIATLIQGQEIECIISGMAKGPDMSAVRLAKRNKIPVVEFPAQWSRYGNSAGPIRNQQMLDEGKPTHVVCFMDCRVNPNGTTGSNHMIKISKEASVPVKVINIKK
jgi:hypothetical protein